MITRTTIIVLRTIFYNMEINVKKNKLKYPTYLELYGCE